MEAVLEQDSAAAAATQDATARIAQITAHATRHSAPHGVFLISQYKARRRAEDISELKAQICAFCVLHNLIGFSELVDGLPSGRIAIVAGGRRLRSVRALVADSDLPDDYTLDYLLLSEAEAIDISLAESHGRAATHPVDVYEAMLASSKKRFIENSTFCRA